MIRQFFTLIAACTFFVSHAQNSTITGIVHTTSGFPLPDAHVILLETKTSFFTNKNGAFRFSQLNPGKYSIQINQLGFHQQIITVNTGDSVVVTLEEFSETLDEVEVNAQSIIGGTSGLKKIGGSSTFISSRELNRFNNSDPMRVLRNVPGINIQEEDGFGLRPNIGMRGTGVERSSKITLMEDGILAAPAPYSAPAAYYFPSMGRMQGVEVLKGSGSIKYGPNTTGGVLNLLTRQIPIGVEANARASIGSYNTREMYAFIGVGNESIGFSLEGLNMASDGFKNLDNQGKTGFNKTDLVAKARVQLPGSSHQFKHSLQLKVGYLEEKSQETYLGLTQEDFNETPFRRYAASQVDEMDARQNQASIVYNARFKVVDVSVSAYRNTFSRNWYKLDKVTDDAGNTYGIGAILENPDSLINALNILKGQSSALETALHVKANNRSYLSQGIQFLANTVFSTGTIEHKIETGMRIHYDEMDRFQWVDDYAMSDGIMQLNASGKPGSESNRIEGAMAYSGFVQYALQFQNRLRIIPGIRYENITFKKTDYGKNDPNREELDLKITQNEVNAIIPGISATYDFASYQNIFVGIHKGFAPPGSTEGTLPESSINYEAGWRLHNRFVHVATTLFANQYSNLLGSDLNAGGGVGTNEQFNAGAAQVYGMEFNASYDLLKKNQAWRLPITFQYTYTHAQFKNNFESNYEPWGEVESGDFMPYLPMQQFGLQASIENNKVSITASTKYAGKMRTVAGIGNIPKSNLIPSNFIIDLSANYRVTKNVLLFAFARNITNAIYLVSRRPAGLRPGLPRLIGGGIKIMI